MDEKAKKLTFDLFVFILSLSVAWWIIKSGVVHQIIDNILPFQFFAEFVTGMLYTSFLTSPISVAMLLSLATESNPIIIALLGGLGAASMDLLMVKFFRKNTADINEASHELRLQRINKFLKTWNIEFLVPLLGALIIASPFPDEIGLLMLGASKLKYRDLAIITYLLNTAGILLIVTPINLLT